MGRPGKVPNPLAYSAGSHKGHRKSNTLFQTDQAKQRKNAGKTRNNAL